jgi:PncC family amidohydrolase
MQSEHILKEAESLVNSLKKTNKKICFAESCTGGLISSYITSISGASEVFDRSFITYSNNAKNEMIGVKKKTLQEFGAVSEETAKEMAIGALKESKADISISVTGIAGPTGGSPEKPVGLVYIGLAHKVEEEIYCEAFKNNFNGNREKVRNLTSLKALKIVGRIIEK